MAWHDVIDCNGKATGVRLFAQNAEALELNLPANCTAILSTTDSVLIEEPPEIELAKMRMERDRLLIGCDWTQLADAPVDRIAWATYRDALRSMPERWPCEWPIPPQ